MGEESATAAPSGRQVWLRLLALAFAIAAVGLPLNSYPAFALLLVATVVVFSGEMAGARVRWLIAAALLVFVLFLQWLLAPPRVDEGHNLFVPSPVLEAGLPPDVYRFMLAAFDAQYPAERRCAPATDGCWRSEAPPRQVYAFSADGIFRPGEMSRKAAGLAFSDPVWWRLGFINDSGTNWFGATDVERAVRDRRFWMGTHRWHLTMPWFEALRLPPEYVGGDLCWRGDVLWEGEGGRFTAVSHADEQCRVISSRDAGRLVFGVSINPETLTIRLRGPGILGLQSFVPSALALAAASAFVLLLVRVDWRRTAVPFLLAGSALLVIAIDDASFIGGMRPFDGGDDGLFYDSVGRSILRHALAGDWWNALRGGEDIFYYGGPGLRYFRAVEHFLFGESYLGYLTLTLVLPFAVWAVFRRFVSQQWALACAIVFVAVPVGTLFGTSFLNYAQWAGRGFADPAAYIFFICGIVPVVGAARGKPLFLPAFCGGLLMALAIFMKPIVAPACAVLLTGAGIAALYQKQWQRLGGLCIGFAPVFFITLHNWIYGHAFVLFSANSAHPLVLTMPPQAYFDAARELLSLHAGQNVLRGVNQIAGWLAGPSESRWLLPVSAAGVAAVVYVLLRGVRYDPWLRLLAGSALAQHAVALFYIATARYHFLTWFLTLVVVAAWLEAEVWPWMQRNYPQTARKLADGPLARTLTWLQKIQTGKLTPGTSL
jgi:hypothetical protein